MRRRGARRKLRARSAHRSLAAALLPWPAVPEPRRIAEEAAARAAREPGWLARASGLGPDTLAGLLPFYLPLADYIADLQRAKAAPFTLGIQGPQGAGKTTLTQLLACVLRDVGGLAVATLSIDDLYLTRAERAGLAARVHPLFQTRGVPGTHDVALGVRVLEALTRPGPCALPRFDKGQDERAPVHTWPVCVGPCNVVLFEGLWLGLPPIPEPELAQPFNALEAEEDAHGTWRAHANQALAGDYPALFARCELLVHIQVPDFECVKRWRSGAEHALRARLEAQGGDTARVMDDAALARFFQHYERFTAHAMRTLPERADVLLQLDREQRVVRSTLAGSTRG
jgi:D-glycerate 3-kinase